MALKRSTSPVQLTATPSPYHSGVTLYESASAKVASAVPLRRSKRVKLDPDAVADIEDAVISSSRFVVVKEETTELELLVPSKRASKEKKTPSPKKAKPIRTALDVPHPAPSHWREVYDAIKEMRKNTLAPVDTMGCDQARHREIDPKARRMSTLVSLMLSSQTKDEVTDAAVAKLREALGGTITVERVLNADEATISDAICKVGFWRRKTQYIKQAAAKLRDEFDSDVPKTVDDLCSLPGVGPKMAFLCLHAAWDLNVGIGVDIHVHRITNRLGWHKPPTKTPEETRLNLQSWLPVELHRDINPMLVGFGQTICVPVGPRCDQCALSSTGLCPSARTIVKKRTAKKRKIVVKDELSDLTDLDTDEAEKE